MKNYFERLFIPTNSYKERVVRSIWANLHEIVKFEPWILSFDEIVIDILKYAMTCIQLKIIKLCNLFTIIFLLFTYLACDPKETKFRVLFIIQVLYFSTKLASLTTLYSLTTLKYLFLIEIVVCYLANAFKYYEDIGLYNIGILYLAAVVAFFPGQLNYKFLMLGFEKVVTACVYSYHNGNNLQYPYTLMVAHAMFILLGKHYEHVMIECVEKVLTIKKEAEIDAQNRNMFVASISHDLKGPLNSLLGCLDLLKNSSRLSSVEKEDLLTALYSGEIMSYLIANILDTSKINAGRFSIDRIPMNPMEEIEKIVKIERKLTKKKGLRLYKKVLTQMPKLVYSDAMRLSQILINLLSNSVKFTSKGYIALILSWSTSITKEENLVNSEEPLIPCESYFKAKEGRQNFKRVSSAKLTYEKRLEENFNDEELEDIKEPISNKLQKYILTPELKANTSSRKGLKQFDTFIRKVSTESSNKEIPEEELSTTIGDSGVLIIEIIDTGIGISEEEQKKLFKPFNQANNLVRSKYGGSGLGLWITKQIVYLMSGFIKLRSEPQKGTRFTISLPLKVVEERSPKGVVKKKVSNVSLLDKTSEMILTLKECKRISFTGKNKILNKMNILFINSKRKNNSLEEQIMKQLRDTNCHLTYSTYKTALNVLAENEYEFDAILIAANSNKYRLMELIAKIIKRIKENEHKQIPFCIASGNL